MKYIYMLCISLALIHSSCKPEPSECVVTLDLAKDTSGILYLYTTSRDEEGKLASKKIISEKFDDGTATIKTAPNENLIYGNVRVGKNNYSYMLFTEKAAIELTLENETIVVNGGKLNKEFYSLLKELNYTEYEKLNFNKNLTENEKKTIQEYETNLISLLDKYPSSLPLAHLIYSKFSSSDDLEILNNILTKFNKELHKTFYLKQLQSQYDVISKSTVGNNAYQFSLKTDKGETVNLTDYKGKIVIIDFWASWCAPCRASIPNMKKLYEKYQPQGVEIIHISTDENKENWLKAVEKENMPWVQLHDSNIASKYLITQLPMIYILDKELKIAAEDVKHDEVEKEIEKLLMK